MTAGATRLVVPLDDEAAEQVDVAGGKAATLSALRRAGCPVPPGVVLTTHAFDLDPPCDAAGTPGTARATRLPGSVERALDRALATLGDVPLAVRSSAVAEDLAEASFAGQYETVLGVCGADELREAVRRCWGSAGGVRPRSYAIGGRGASPKMALLIQRLVEAESAGVAFTANPLSGARDEVVVNAVRGLADRLVSGEVTPDEWLVREDKAVCKRSPEQAISASQALEVAALARRVEEHFGAPQDIEWAIAKGSLFLVQARPITALSGPGVEPVPVTVDPPPGVWQREADHAPQPWSPLQRSIFMTMRDRATKRWCDDFGLLFDHIAFREIGGWEYVRVVPIGEKDQRPPPDWLLRVLWRVVPSLRSRIAHCVAAVRQDRAGQLVERWYGEWLPQLEGRNSELGEVDPAGLDDDELVGHVKRLLAHVEWGVEIHARLHGAEMVVLAEIVFTCRDLLGWDEAQVFTMLSGLSRRSTEPARRLAELADLARSSAAIRELLEVDPDEAASRLVEVDAEFASAFDGYLRSYGRRALRYELADPTIAEMPGLVLRLLREQLVLPYEASGIDGVLARERDDLVATARGLLARRPKGDGERFERALVRAERAYPVREDNECYTISVPFAILRYALLELGERVAHRGGIATRDDVFFLEYPEAIAALRENADRAELVQRRKGERAWVLGHPGPALYGEDPGAPPSFSWLPSEARFAHEALLWVIDRMGAPVEAVKRREAPVALRGIAASPGRYTGTVRVIEDESRFGKLRAGDVLVCPITSPVWSVLFPSVGALVTDTGGILAHAAIIAREYRVPAVVATCDATSSLRDGQVVTVDGTAGTVEVDQA